MSEENKGKVVELGDKVKGEIILPTIDVSPYIGKKAKIAEVTENEGNYGYYIKVESDVVATLDDVKDKETGKPLELKASRIFGLQTDADGAIGWGKDTKLGLFLKKMGVKHYNNLKGKEVVIQTQTSKTGTDFLSF